MKTSRIEDVKPQIVDKGVKRWVLLFGEKLMLVVYQMDPGASFPIHSHPHEQIGYVLRGNICYITDAGKELLKEGTAYLFSSNERHGSENPGPGVVFVIDVFAPPREDFLRRG